jgi:hypothetical protein
MLRCEKGQLDGFAVKSITGKPGAADQGLVSGNAAGHNKRWTETDSHLAPVEWQHKPKRANG